MKNILTYFIIFLSPIVGLAQDCSTPITLCSEQPENIDFTFFSGAFTGPCFSSIESVFYEFTTNDNQLNTSAFLPYSVEVSITIEDCVDAGIDLPVTAGLYEASLPSDPCAGLTEVTTCITDNNSIDFNSGVLMPNTTYIIVLGIDPTTAGFTCGIDVVISGAPLEIDACCDANLILGESTNPQVFGATPLTMNDEYTWLPVEGLDDFQASSPIAAPLITTTYTVSALVGDCVATDDIIVNISTVEIIRPYDIFTPNGDGLNDTWLINEIDKFENPQVNIYDRWGQRVFQSIGYDQPWDGTNDGKRLAAGTYYYVIEINTAKGIEQLTGFTSLLN